MAESQLSLAAHYVSIDQPDRALAALRSVDGDALEDSEFWRLQAVALYGVDDNEGAVRAAGEGLAREPDSVALLALLAIAQAELDRLAEAERSILAALELAPDDSVVLCAYARVLARGGQLAKAERVLDLAAQSDPHDTDVVRMRALLALLKGRDRQAARISEQVLAEDPEDAAAHALRGSALMLAGDARGASPSLASAVRDDPTDAQLAGSARMARAWTHPLLWPLVPIQRLGVAGSWIASVAIIYGLRAAGLNLAAGIATAIWLFIVAYSWLAAPAISRWLTKRGP